jgi:hypothetical protein
MKLRSPFIVQIEGFFGSEVSVSQYLGPRNIKKLAHAW